MARFTGKTVIVTGAARGQGAAEAELFAEEGANVVATDIFAGGGVLVHDIADEASWRRVVDNALARWAA